MQELIKIPFYKQWPHYQKIIVSPNYSKWKEGDVSAQKHIFYHINIGISAIYVIINLIVRLSEEEQTSHIILLITFIVGEFITIAMQYKYSRIQAYFFMQHCLITIHILLQGQNEETNKLFIIQYFIFLRCHSSILVKLLLYVYFVCAVITIYEYGTFEILVIAFSLLICNFQAEAHQIANYIKQLKLLSIIEQMPNAVCIIDTNSKTIVYSNQYFDKLAQTLQAIGDDSSQTVNNHTREQLQLEFIRNLNLEEIKNNGFQISDFIPQQNDEGITDDQFKIVNVDFKRYASQNTLQNVSFIYPNSASLKKKSRDIFHNINTSDYSLQSQRKSFITTINLQLQISHQPKSFMLSAQTKRRKKSSNQINVGRQQSSKNISQLPKFQDLQSSLHFEQLKLSPNHTDVMNHHLVDVSEQGKCHEPSNDGQMASTNHKVRLMVNLIQMNDILNAESDFQIYCINELSPLLLQYTVKKLEQAKKNIMRSLSHELRTSLNAVNGYISEAYEKIDNILQVEKNLELSLKYVALMQLKLQDFFDYRDILEDKFQLKEEKFNLKDVIIASVDLIKDQCSKKKLNLSLQLPKEQIFIYGDKVRLQQVLINLLSNGIKYTSQGGIIVRVSLDNQINSFQVPEDIFEMKQQHLVQIRIIDSGQGMKDELKGILNKKFLSVDDDAKISKDSVGIGVGLSVCQSIIKAMGPQGMNSLFLQSILDVGTQFYFFLNCCQVYEVYEENSDAPEHENKSETIVKTSPTKQSMKMKKNNFQYSASMPNSDCNCNSLLLVDDEQFNLEILSQIINNLNTEKYHIVTAFNGRQALDRIRQYCQKCQHCIGFKAILMDINMPIMNGWDCAGQIRLYEQRNNIVKKTPIIAITGYGGQKDQEKCLKAGFDYVATKPANKDSLLSIFRKFNV